MNDATKKNVLVEIAEDDPGLSGLLADRMIAEGYSVVKADNGDAALEVALGRHPDIILLDVMMPKMNGIEVLKKLRTDDWGRNARVMLLTNDPDTNKVEQAIVSGVFDYLVKTDFDLDEIVQKIKTRLASAGIGK